MGIRVAILDSGIDVSHPVFKDYNIEEYVLGDGEWKLTQELIKPVQGHGTGVASIIAKNSRDIEIVSFRIFNEKMVVKPQTLLSVLEFIYQNIDCDVINMSLGIRLPNENLEEICKKLYEKGVLLVSAFDNAGGVSYPAAYDSVIGVDKSYRCVKAKEFVYVKNSIVNLKAKGGNQRMAWINPEYIINQGSSFASAYVTARVADLLEEGISYDKVLLKILEECSFVYDNQIEFNDDPEFFESQIKKASVFPYNKEVHSLINYAGLLSFEIVQLFDSKLSGRLGKKVSSLDGKYQYTVENIEKCDWEAIDTFILGHTFEMDFLAKTNTKDYIIKKCIEHNINIYSFDEEIIKDYRSEFKEKSIKAFWPSIKNSKRIINKFGKMYNIKAPVLGVLGTSHQQGKFTLQLALRQLFIKNGYNICQLGTEPHALLFGMNFVFPFGYGSFFSLSDKESIEILNYYMHEMDAKNPDIIVTGSQAGTIPMRFNNMVQYRTEQLAFLMGTKPDGVILCVNYHDNMKDIKRSIKGIEALADCKVIAISVFPVGYQTDWDIMCDRKTSIDSEKLKSFCASLSGLIEVPSYVLGEPENDKRIFETCIDYFAKK